MEIRVWVVVDDDLTSMEMPLLLRIAQVVRPKKVQERLVGVLKCWRLVLLRMYVMHPALSSHCSTLLYFTDGYCVRPFSLAHLHRYHQPKSILPKPRVNDLFWSRSLHY